jgi:hypothetical protein
MRARGLYARLYRLNYASFDDLSEDLPSVEAMRSARETVK